MVQSTTETTAAVILAAGGGSRFGGPTHKLLAPFRGRPVLVHAVEAALAAELSAVLVITGSVDVSGVVPEGATLVPNPRWSRGQGTSLQAGLVAAEQAGYDAVVVGLGDQPLIAASSWKAVAASPSPIAVATYGGQRRNPVRLHRSVWPLLPTEGDFGARRVIAEHPELVSEVPCQGSPVDIDTLEDLDQWS